MRLIRGQTSISVPKNNFRFSGKPRQPTPRQDQNRSHVQFPQSAHTESKELAPTFLRREVSYRIRRVAFVHGNEPVRSVIGATEIGRAITSAKTQPKWAPTPRRRARASLAISDRERMVVAANSVGVSDAT